MADILNTAFAGYDKVILTVLHFFGKYLGFILTPVMKIVTVVGEKGIIFFALAVVLACFSKTRKTAVCLFGSVCCGALITNIILKDTVARIRPYEAVELYRQWWEIVGASAEKGFSFPSGHVTAAASGMTALCRAEGKKYRKATVIWVGVMAFARNYLMVHYPSDVLFAAIFGVASAFIAWEITKLIFYFLEKYKDYGFCKFALHFDVPMPSALTPYLVRLGLKEAESGEEEEKPVRSVRYDREEAPRRTARSASGKKSVGLRRKKGKHEL